MSDETNLEEFCDLPEDIVEYIFLHLSPYGDLQNCRLVCKLWHRLAQGAIERLQKLLIRCSTFDWFLLQPPENGKYRPLINITERCSHNACFHPGLGCIFVFGGCTAAYTTFNDLWKFDLAAREWVRPMPTGSYPTPKACSTMVEYKGKLLLFGGWSKSSPNPIHQTAMFYNELHVYDPRTNVWTPVSNDGSAPHLAGHSCSIVDHRMIIFGGSHGAGSSNQIWVFDIDSCQWYTPPTTTPKPAPRYGQSQVLLDESHILIVGGCGGPNLIFSDIWLLTLNGPDVWRWEEVTVMNPHLSAPQLWSHPACKVGDKVLVLSKPPRSSGTDRGSYRSMSTSPRAGDGAVVGAAGRNNWVPPQGNLIPPRQKKLISSRSLDEQNPPPSPKSQDRHVAELQRARSIPAIIVGEIPQLVVTEDSGDGAATATDNNNPFASNFGANSPDDQQGSSMRPLNNPAAPAVSRNSQCIAMAASSLLPYEATEVDPPPPAPNVEIGAIGRFNVNSRNSASAPSSPGVILRNNSGGPAVQRPHTGRNWDKQMEALRRMEDYIRSRSQQNQISGGSAVGRGGMKFRPSSPPPKTKRYSPSDFHLSKNPMTVYVLDVSRVISSKTVSWSVLDENFDAPEDTMLYSLVKGRGELILFGGMRNNPTYCQGLDVAPLSHTITNETYILKPPISL